MGKEAESCRWDRGRRKTCRFTSVAKAYIPPEREPICVGALV